MTGVTPMQMRYFWVACVGLSLACGPLWADDKEAKSKAEPVTDATFIQKAADGGMTEVQAGKLAQTHAQNADVKKFGARMVADHTKANMELMAIAKELRATVPEKISAKHEKMIAKLTEQKGVDFDKEYMHHMVEGHQEMADLLTHASKELKDERLRGFAEKTLPTVKEHLEMAKKIHAQVEKGGK